MGGGLEAMISMTATQRLTEFRLVCAAHPYVPKGVFYGELFLFLEVCWHARVSTLIESGVKFGFSTRMLRTTFRGPMISIDREPCRTPEGVDFVQGDAMQEIPRILARMPGQRYGILIDGPKGDVAIALKNTCLDHESVRVVAVHDAPRGRGETFHSLDPVYREYAGRELDALIEHPYAAKYPDGPGLAVWVSQ
jgi:hypothetical protein